MCSLVDCVNELRVCGGYCFFAVTHTMFLDECLAIIADEPPRSPIIDHRTSPRQRSRQMERIDGDLLKEIDRSLVFAKGFLLESGNLKIGIYVTSLCYGFPSTSVVYVFIVWYSFPSNDFPHLLRNVLWNS